MQPHGGGLLPGSRRRHTLQQPGAPPPHGSAHEAAPVAAAASSSSSSSGSGGGSLRAPAPAAPSAAAAAASSAARQRAVAAAAAPAQPPPAFTEISERGLDLPAPGFDAIPDALAAMAAGQLVVVLDDEDRENEGDLICAADRVTPEAMAFMVRHTSGVVCVGMEGADLDRLRIPLMVSSAENEEAMYTAFTVTVDLREGTSTGISAAGPRRHAARAGRPRRPAPGLQAAWAHLPRCAAERCGRARRRGGRRGAGAQMQPGTSLRACVLSCGV